MTAHPPDTTARALLAERDYLRYLAMRWVSVLGSQIQTVAMGWQIYTLARTGRSVEESALQLGWLGLASFLPLFLLALPAGWAADRHERKKIVLACIIGEAVTLSVLISATMYNVVSVPLLIGVAVVFGASRAFFHPTATAMVTMLIPRPLLPRAIAWNSLGWQSASVAGPAVGGVLVAISPLAAYATGLALYAIGALCLVSIKRDTQPVPQIGSPWTLVREGLSYVWKQKIVFGAISLDLFAVLLGGATALLPVFARDVLHVGAEGFGLLRAGPAIGATCVALVLANAPIRAHAGVFILGGVFVFGAATVVFGVSTLFPLSVSALIVLGGADMLSVYVRQTLIQLVTPDPMRGRVAAVSTLFISASNELGEFESGVAARFLGPIGAAIFGGVGAIIVVLTWAKLFPSLRKADKLV
ncbi:MAG TPA: MFS transporter [Caulobacterales bacterium]|nr:MFS transporter [Caulobacterales bacterium]